MPYTPTTWADNVTPVDAARLNHIETGLDVVTDTAEAAIPKTIAGVATDRVPVYNGTDWVAQKIVDAQIDAAAAIDFSKLASAAWAQYTPVWASSAPPPVVGNGALVGRYVKVGKLVVATIELAMGSTTTFGGTGYSFTLPLNARSSSYLGVGFASMLDSSPFNLYTAIARRNSATQVQLDTPASPAGQVGVSVPVTWAQGDSIWMTVLYEAA